MVGGAFMLAMILFFVVFALAVIGVVVAISRGAAQRGRDNVAPEVSAAAAVVDKRLETSGGGERMITQSHYVAFEQADGTRFELEVPPGEYGLLVVGDRGTVTMKGSRYLGFAREILR